MCAPRDGPVQGAGEPTVLPPADLKSQRPDAGMRHHDHYALRLPEWRNKLRKYLIPIVRWETPYLAFMQDKMRTPALDSYFAFTANLGTHTFFMVMLPILFWCGYTSMGRAMVHVLAAGVFWSGFVKDMLCLPRPLSPPLQRITMSGSAALEYGFPSTHSTNAVSVAVYAIQMLQSTPETHYPTLYLALQVLFYFYAISIIFGRLYCGMHGFFDVILGSLLGAGLSVIQILYGDAFDNWICQGSYTHPLIATLIILVLVRIHPEPADDCPCFDDSVAFAGTAIGVQVGAWHFASTGLAWDYPIPSTVPFDLENIGLVKATIRICVGVVVIFAWRGIMKPAMLKILPPIFRVLEDARLSLPRAFFLTASQYTSVPKLHGDDNVIPSASDIPRLLTNLRHPRQRSVSVGPQSAADAYETLAYRNKRRRESLTSDAEKSPISITGSIPEGYGISTNSKHPPNVRTNVPLGADLLPTPISSRVHSYEQMMGSGEVIASPGTPPYGEASYEYVDKTAGVDGSDDEKEDREIFLKLERPRVRYDVEVITKLIVYTGIAWLAVEGNPILFEIFGLGMTV
ncbi:PAP2-domain-containing protein [Mytilinidion resinicola]|uniref:PAP2-domain-containing protein n=1 Tax=Mytilinidion resinicola TaxID=574789 RepID=A0A6A6YXL5_9PEZI|nr:PAP2-domain-containing protein [Mytilinidion resinicola]KAF2813163.1 PAP2-domain-containing protein [Mytilinidion resinicola]